MPKKRSVQILVTYVVSLGLAIALLVVWVVYVVQSSVRLNELASRVGVAAGSVHWIVLAIGCALFFLLIVGITYQLAQSVAERRYSRKQEEFVSNVTHELKSPLAAIKLHTQTLQQDDLDAAARERSLQFVLQQADRMATLIDNVLESSRLLARKKLLDLAPIDLGRFFAGYFEEVRVRLARQEVRLAVALDTSAWVLATADALHRVMDNLLDNAVRFSDPGGEVRCRVSDGPATAMIEIEDDGIGIPKGELAKIFDRFYQIGRATGGRRRGSGLGLSIVDGLVREMRGTVRAFSQEGRPGTRFVVELPLAEASA
jgi:two-component system, OmpR family, phosphate regulon sensor histidine kinase PhoR